MRGKFKGLDSTRQTTCACTTTDLTHKLVLLVVRQILLLFAVSGREVSDRGGDWCDGSSNCIAPRRNWSYQVVHQSFEQCCFDLNCTQRVSRFVISEAVRFALGCFVHVLSRKIEVVAILDVGFVLACEQG